MNSTIELVLDLDDAENEEEWRRQAADRLGVAIGEITGIRVRKRSLDARHSPAKVRLRAEIFLVEPPPEEQTPRPEYREVTGPRRAIIVGSGPAGMFAALRLIEHGIRPIVLDRGKDVRARRRDLVAIQRHGIVNPDSNYCFGEGGAGTYSDGKLYTRSTKRGSIDDVLRTLVAHGAAAEILVDAHPHIGSNRLPGVVAAMRESVIGAGGQVHFAKRVVDLIVRDGAIAGVVTADGDEYMGDAVIVATGHSARDIFRLFAAHAILIEPKPFAMGVRIEHPQPLIDRIQYRSAERHPKLPAASYRLASTVRQRGVFSFCMCPGGFIVPSATEQDEVVVNGMSLSRRDSPFANSGLVVSVETEDLAPFAGHGVLAGVAYQKSLEVMAAEAGGGVQRAPAQRVTDFIAGRGSSSLPPCSYKPGITAMPLHELLPPALSRRLQAGLREFGGSMRGYVTEEAIVVGVETRTSSPVRVPRDHETLEHPQVARLYPCGEGAGYAGGIVSAAIDGMRVADALASRYG
jgi:uncharacterized FAD-dependent dehydrogenase